MVGSKNTQPPSNASKKLKENSTPLPVSHTDFPTNTSSVENLVKKKEARKFHISTNRTNVTTPLRYKDDQVSHNLPLPYNWFQVLSKYGILILKNITYT